jgi:Spy/CpxP family protein refolding chaperone
MKVSFPHEFYNHMEIKMKIKQKHFLMMLFIMFFFYGAIFSQNSRLLLLDFRENQLKERLQLTPRQVDSVKEIVKMLQAQESLDRQNFKKNALALVAAAVRRAQMAEMKLSNDLDDSQKATLMEMKKEQNKDREFFSLNEGLILTVEQAAKVKTILQIYTSKRPVRGDAYDNMLDLYDPMDYGYGYGPGYGMQGNIPGTMPGTSPHNMPGTMQGDMMRTRRPYAMRMNDGLIEKLKKHEAKKEKAIEPILTPEQKILFNQLKEVRHKELEMMLEKLRQERNSQ